MGHHLLAYCNCSPSPIAAKAIDLAEGSHACMPFVGTGDQRQGLGHRTLPLHRIHTDALQRKLDRRSSDDACRYDSFPCLHGMTWVMRNGDPETDDLEAYPCKPPPLRLGLPPCNRWPR